MTEANRPRNLLVKDANHPFQLALKTNYDIVRLTVHQTPNDETWPGGALWDAGLLLARIVAAMGGIREVTTVLTDEKGVTRHQTTRPVDAELDWREKVSFDTVLELGCGVGLTGLAAAVALAPKLVLLTDLAVVVDQVTTRNVVQNTTERAKQRFMGPTKSTRVVPVPLSWGDAAEEDHVKGILWEHRATVTQSTHRRRKTRKKGKDHIEIPPERCDHAVDLVLIGDVAYQQRPGAPSHFDIFLSTLLQFVDEHTLVLFGTRIRMAASMDLLDMLHEHFCPVREPLSAEDIEPSVAEVKHNMSFHFLKLKKTTQRSQADL